MKIPFKSSVYKSCLYNLISPVKLRLEWAGWLIRRRADPPPCLIKQKIILFYAERYGLNTLIETGTYLGDTVYSLRKKFAKIISIELDKELYESAKKRLRKYSHISLVFGDSMQLLKPILSTINEPALFWLDAHFSGGITSRGESNTPVLGELDAILAHPVSQHVVLIDDARCFKGKQGYPTLESIQAAIETRALNLKIKVQADIIRIHN